MSNHDDIKVPWGLVALSASVVASIFIAMFIDVCDDLARLSSGMSDLRREAEVVAAQRRDAIVAIGSRLSRPARDPNYVEDWNAKEAGR